MIPGNVPTARKPHRDWAGYVTERRNYLSGGHNVLVRAGPAALDADGGTWVTICDVHGTLCNHRNRALAYGHLPLAEWCEECQAIARVPIACPRCGTMGLPAIVHKRECCRGTPWNPKATTLVDDDGEPREPTTGAE